MKNLLTPMILVTAMGASPVMAEARNVSDSTLASLGLGGMELLSDADGMSVRGMAATGYGSGTTVAGWMVFEKNTGALFYSLGSNRTMASAEQGASGQPVTTMSHPSHLYRGIHVAPNLTSILRMNNTDIVIDTVGPGPVPFVSFSLDLNFFEVSTETSFQAQ